MCVCVCVDGLSIGSTLTTKELQQKWRAIKKRDQPVQLLFEISSSRIVEQALSKFVVRRDNFTALRDNDLNHRLIC